MSVPHYDPEYEAYSDECTNRNAGYRSTWALPPSDETLPLAPLVLRDCANPLCARSSEAVFCSEYCRQTIEGPADETATAYYHDETAATLLGHKATADAQRARDGESLAALVCHRRSA